MACFLILQSASATENLKSIVNNNYNVSFNTIFLNVLFAILNV